MVVGKFLDRNDRGHPFPRFHRDQVNNRRPSGLTGSLRDLEPPQPVDSVGIGKEEYIVMGGGNKEVLHKILFLGLERGYPPPTAALASVGGNRQALNKIGRAHV